MTTRSDVLTISDQIVNYFSGDLAPTWNQMAPSFNSLKFMKVSGIDTLSEDFLKRVFANSDDILNKLNYFKLHHHYLTMLLLVDEYMLNVCRHCGHIDRKLEIPSEKFNDEDPKKLCIDGFDC